LLVETASVSDDDAFMITIYHRTILDGTVHAFTSPDLDGLFVTGPTKGKAYSELLALLRVSGRDQEVVEGEGVDPTTSFVRDRSPIRIESRKVGTKHVCTSPDVKGLFVAHADAGCARSSVESALAMLERMEDRISARNRHRGSSFDSFLEEEGLLEEVNAEAIRRVERWKAGQETATDR
jgi:hypothetical protein